MRICKLYAKIGEGVKQEVLQETGKFMSSDAIMVLVLVYFCILCPCLVNLSESKAYDKGLADFTGLNIVSFFFAAPVVLLVFLFVKKINPFLVSRPLKSARFKIGEQVTYQGEQWTVLYNEKSFEGKQIVIGR